MKEEKLHSGAEGYTRRFNSIGPFIYMRVLGKYSKDTFCIVFASSRLEFDSAIYKKTIPKMMIICLYFWRLGIVYFQMSL